MVQNNRRAGGLIRTALRATDILMDRVWQLENESFKATSGFVFARITDIVEPADDPTALNTEIQRQLPRVRTDLDRFSSLEISSLVQHGYSVARKACRTSPELFGVSLPDGPPWNPIPSSSDQASDLSPAINHDERSKAPSQATVQARALQASASRRIVSALLDYRDWASYVYVPLMIPIFFLLPYFVTRFYQRSHRMNQLVNSVSQASMDLDKMNALLDAPIERWTGTVAEEVEQFDEPNFEGFEVLQDSRLLDLRRWKSNLSNKNDLDSFVYGYQRIKVLKLHENRENNRFRVRVLPTNAMVQVRFPAQTLQPKLKMCNVESPVDGEQQRHWEVTADFSKVPNGESVDVIIEFCSPGSFLRDNGSSTTLVFDLQFETADVARWLLLPAGKEYRNFRIIRYKSDSSGEVEAVKVVNEYLADDSSILAYKLLSVKSGYTYEVTWYYK